MSFKFGKRNKTAFIPNFTFDNEEINSSSGNLSSIINKYNEAFNETCFLEPEPNVVNTCKRTNSDINVNIQVNFYNTSLNNSNSGRDQGNSVNSVNAQINQSNQFNDSWLNPSNPFNNSRQERKVLYRLSELEENNLYHILNVNEGDPLPKIKKSYKSLCFKNHPDKGGNPDAFLRVAEAYKILSNKTYRKLYDEYGSKILEYFKTNNTFFQEEDLDNETENEEINMELLRTVMESMF